MGTSPVLSGLCGGGAWTIESPLQESSAADASTLTLRAHLEGGLPAWLGGFASGSKTGITVGGPDFGTSFQTVLTATEEGGKGGTSQFSIGFPFPFSLLTRSFKSAFFFMENSLTPFQGRISRMCSLAARLK